MSITLLARHASQRVPPAKLKISGANGDKIKLVVPTVSHEQEGKAYPVDLYNSYLKQTRYLAQPITSHTPRRTCHSHRLSSEQVEAITPVLHLLSHNTHAKRIGVRTGQCRTWSVQFSPYRCASLPFSGIYFFVFYPELNIKHVQDDVPTMETPMGNTKKGTTLKDIARDRFLPDGGLPPLLQKTEG